MELRLIRASIKKTMDTLIEEKTEIDPESDSSVEITNDLMVYQNIIEKISEREDV